MVTQSQLQEIFSYNPGTGILTWIKPKSPRVKIGDRAGWKRADGYRAVQIGKDTFQEHQLIWLYVHGYIPDKQLDHKDHIRDNNKLLNLREAGKAANAKNQKLHCANSSGFCGVRWHKQNQNWNARITHEGEEIFLGSFKNKADAITARQQANVKYGFHPNHGRTL